MTASNGGPTALIVDDEAIIAMALSAMVRRLGLRVAAVAATAKDAVELAARLRPDLVLMDVRLKGDEDGVSAAIRIFAAAPVPIIYITASQEPETVDRIHEDHPSAVLFKPILPRHLEAAVRRVLG